MNVIALLAPYIAQIIEAIIKAAAESGATIDSIRSAAHKAIDDFKPDELKAQLDQNNAIVDAEISSGR